MNDDRALAAAAPAPASAAGWLMSRAESALLAAIAVAIALKFALIFRIAVHWDEFYFLSFVHDYARGTLDARFQTFHVHLFSWLPGLGTNEAGQVVAARAVMAVLAAASAFLIYGIARRFATREAALFGVLVYLSLSVVVEHGTGFRTDPIATFLDRKAGKPFFPDLVARAQPPLLLADSPSLHLPRPDQRRPKALYLDQRPKKNHRRRQTRAPSVRFDPLATHLAGGLLWCSWTSSGPRANKIRPTSRHVRDVSRAESCRVKEVISVQTIYLPPRCFARRKSEAEMSLPGSTGSRSTPVSRCSSGNRRSRSDNLTGQELP